jgi:hypothetical protein
MSRLIINVDRLILSTKDDGEKNRFDSCVKCNDQILRHIGTDDGHIYCSKCNRICFSFYRDIKRISLDNRQLEISITS